MGLFDRLHKKSQDNTPAPQDDFEPVQPESYTPAEEPDKKAVKKMKNDVSDLEAQIKRLRKESSKLEEQVLWLRNEIPALTEQREQLIRELRMVEDAISLQEFGLYEPRFDFCSVEEYKNALTDVRNRQKDLIKYDQAVSGSTNWTVNNNAAQGRKMVNDMKKLLLRAFNSECDEIVAKVKYNNIDASEERIRRSRDAISKLGAMMGVEICPEYYQLKIRELHIALEYQIAKQEEKERLKELREQQREEARLQREIEAERKKIEKEKKHFLNALKAINDQLQRGEGDQEALLAKQQEMQAELGEIDKALADVDYRAANQKAGFVYVISNIGSFGPDVYKIGMTRRLDPTERVDELGDASVPFNFDIHAMIFSEDAPALEAALHRAFDSKKLNLVNSRREFFKVSLAEIKAEVKKNYSKTTEWFDEPDAEQFRISEKMREDM